MPGMTVYRPDSMMDYAALKFQALGVELSSAELYELQAMAGVDLSEANVTDENIRRMSVALTEFIPALLAHPTSVSENGFSITRNVQGLKDYHAFLCRKYGVENLLDDSKPKIRFL